MSQQYGKKSSKFDKCDWQFLCRIVFNCIGAIGFGKKHNFKHNIGVYEGDVASSSKPRWQKEIYVVVKSLLQLVDSNYIGVHEDFCLPVNAMSVSNTQEREDGMFDHCDNQYITYQYALTIGEYKGGNLVRKSKDGRLINVSNIRRFVRFDGRLPHKVNSIVSGQRYSFIYYKTYDRSLGCKPQPILSYSEYMVASNIFKEAGGKIDDSNYNLSSSQKFDNLKVCGCTWRW